MDVKSFNFSDFKYNGFFTFVNKENKIIDVRIIIRGLRIYENDYDFSHLVNDILKISNRKFKTYSFFPDKIRMVDFNVRGGVVLNVSYDFMDCFRKYILEKFTLINPKVGQENYYFGIYSGLHKQCFVHPFNIELLIEDTTVCNISDICGYIQYETNTYIETLDKKIEKILEQMKKLEKIL